MMAFESSRKGHRDKGNYARSHMAFGWWEHRPLFAPLEKNGGFKCSEDGRKAET